MGGLRVNGQIEHADVQELLDRGVQFRMDFDGSHARRTKAPHFELQLDLTVKAVERLRGTHIAGKLGLASRAGAGVTRFEIDRYANDLVRRSPRATDIQRAIAAVKQGRPPGMIRDVYRSDH